MNHKSESWQPLSLVGRGTQDAETTNSVGCGRLLISPVPLGRGKPATDDHHFWIVEIFMPPDLKEAEMVLLEFALTLPQAFVDFPWGGQEQVLKVNNKIFAFISVYSFPKQAPPRLRVGVKLPDSLEGALAMPFTREMGYNMGKSRWVLASFAEGGNPPLPLLMDWIEESYRAIAPGTLAAQLQG